MRPMPDALVLVVDEEWRLGVWEVIERIPAPRPPLFIVSQIHDIEMMRLAMRYGVRDVFPTPLQVEECVTAITSVVQEDRARRGATGSRLISFMNTKGGSGASLIAANVALAMAMEARFSRPILLVDFDFQFGGLPTYLNLIARDGLIKAMEFVDTLDATAIQAYVLRHPSGLMATILSHSDVIALATQQTVAHLHDTKRLLYLLRDRLAINMDRIILLVNRFDTKSEVKLEDFSDVFPNIPIETLPSDYVRASESVNLGIPICESAANSPLGKSLLRLAKTLAGGEGAKAAATSGARLAAPAPATPPPKKSGRMFGWLKGS